MFLLFIQATVPTLVQAQELPSSQDWSYGADRYGSLVWGFGRRPVKVEQASISGSFRDESPIPETFIIDRAVAERTKGTTMDMGMEFGDFHGKHFEFGGTWAFGAPSMESFYLGFGYNALYLLQGRVVLRGVAGLSYGNANFSLGNIPINTLNMTINETEFFESVEVKLRSNVLELRPRGDLVIRVAESFYLKSSLGWALPLLRTKGKLVFQGEGISGGSQVAKEKLSSDNISLRVEDEPLTRFIDMGAGGAFLNFALAIDLAN